MFPFCADADHKMKVVHPLSRLSPKHKIVAATSLLHEIYVITENSDTVYVYFCHRPHHLKASVHIPRMNPVDIATSYADVCVYILDSDNVCLWRVYRNLTTKKYPLDANPGEALKSMSITQKGVVVIVQSGNKIVMYDPLNGDTKHVSLDGVLGDGKFIVHATVIGENRLIACHDTQTLLYDLERTEVCSIVNRGGNHMTLKNSECAIIADTTGKQVWMLDVENKEMKNERFLTLEKGEMETPRHVHYALENGLLLLSSLSCLGVHSFDKVDVDSHLAATKTEPRQQQESGTAALKTNVSQSETHRPVRNGEIAVPHWIYGKLLLAY